MKIGWYIDHQGVGQRSRALAVARNLSTDVVGFSSLAAPQGWPGEWVHLPAPEGTHQEQAGGVFHHAPLGDPQHRRRMAVLADRLGRDVRVMVTDLSVEVTLLGRLMGARTVMVTLRGDRRDRAHASAFDAADVLIAPWLPAIPEPTWEQSWTDKAVFTGAISRFDDLVPTGPRRPRTVLVLWGAGDEAPLSEIAAAQRATGDWSWTVRTPESPSPDLWAELCESAVVVAHAGDSALAEIAAANAPAVIIPQERPYGEQHSTARVLRQAGCGVVLQRWPAADQWPAVLDAAVRKGGDSWGQWSTGIGGTLAAEVLEGQVRIARTT